MSALDGKYSVVSRFIRKFRGGSQPILVEASDGFKYVLKFTNNPQGPNVPFNEAMGNELYRAAGLPVTIWKPLNVTREFLDQTPQCWLELTEGSLRPEAGLCFGTRYLGREGVRHWEILPRSSFSRIVNKGDFYRAWLVDVCARHADNRQAVFAGELDGFYAIFVDHGNMFSGPNGAFCRLDYRASAYLDTRIYEGNQSRHGVDFAKAVLNIDVDDLWIRSEQLPKEWLTDSALRSFAACLCVLSDTKAVRNIAELIAGFSVSKDSREFLPDERQRGFPDWLLRAGVQSA